MQLLDKVKTRQEHVPKIVMKESVVEWEGHILQVVYILLTPCNLQHPEILLWIPRPRSLGSLLMLWFCFFFSFSLFLYQSLYFFVLSIFQCSCFNKDKCNG